MSTDYGLPCDYGVPTDEKAPEETTRVIFRFAERLAGESIVTSEFELPDGLTSEEETSDGTAVMILVSGGTDGRLYRITCTVTTNTGRTLQQVRRVAVREG